MENLDKFAINGQEYTLAPLRCKHLKQISRILTDQQTNGVTHKNVWDSLEQWVPFMGESIRLGGAKDFQDETLDELTLTEFGKLWTQITAISGIRIQPKGEEIPVATKSTGHSSTVESVVPPDGPTVM